MKNCRGMVTCGHVLYLNLVVFYISYATHTTATVPIMLVSQMGSSQPLFPGSCLPARPASRYWCAFCHLAQQLNSSLKSAATRESSPAPLTVATGISNAEQCRRDWAIVRRLVVHIWPKNDWGMRGRVVLGLSLLISGKVRYTSALFLHISHEMNDVVVATKHPGPTVFQGNHRHS